MKATVLFCDRQWRRLPFVDSHTGDISITRALAIYFAWKAGRVIDYNHGVTLNVLWLCLASLSAAFGKSTFGFLLTRMSYRGEAKQENRTEDITLRLPNNRTDDERHGGGE